MRLALFCMMAQAGALAQAPVIIFTSVGPLSCGMRLWQPGQVQEYCYHNVPPNPLKAVCNALHVITPSSPDTSLPVAASQSCFATDVQGGNIYEVTWLIWQPIAAIVPGSIGTIQYQIAATKQPCAINEQGACVGSGTPITTMQQGSFPSGVIAQNLTTIQADPDPAVNLELNPGPQWDFTGPVLANDQYAQLVTPAGLCVVSSPSPGIAQFHADASGAVRVSWLPEGWCEGATSTPTVQGICSLVDVTIAQSEDGRCTAIPAEPVTSLSQGAMLSFQPKSAVIQGK